MKEEIPGTTFSKKKKRDENLKFNKPVNFNLAQTIEKSSKVKQYHFNPYSSRILLKKDENDKRHVVTTKNQPKLPIIITPKPVVIKPPKENCKQEDDIKEELPAETKKRKLTTLKKRINEVRRESNEDPRIDSDHSIEAKFIKLEEIFIPETKTDLRDSIQTYIKTVAQISKNLYTRDIEKAKQHRFVITGLHETIHYAKFNKAQFICIAEDIIVVDEICDLLHTIVTHCNDNAITIVQCFKRRKLARLFGRGQSMSCICILKDPYTIGNDLKILQEKIRSQLP